MAWIAAGSVRFSYSRVGRDFCLFFYRFRRLSHGCEGGNFIVGLYSGLGAPSDFGGLVSAPGGVRAWNGAWVVFPSYEADVHLGLDVPG